MAMISYAYFTETLATFTTFDHMAFAKNMLAHRAKIDLFLA